jgi:hypothetical protein
MPEVSREAVRTFFGRLSALVRAESTVLSPKTWNQKCTLFVNYFDIQLLWRNHDE